MPDIYCVRGNGGEFTEEFKNGGYVAIGWSKLGNLSFFGDKEEIKEKYKEVYPDEDSEYVIGQKVGEIYRFYSEIEGEDYVITPCKNTDYVYYGTVEKDAYYFEENPKDNCPYSNRKKVNWCDEKIQRSEFSIPLQYSLRSTLTVFHVDHKKSFFKAIDKPTLIPEDEKVATEEINEVVLNNILSLDHTEFEILVTELLSAMGFESEHVGKVRDGGVDAEGELNVSNIAKIKIIVQAKRYKLDKKIGSKKVKKLRASIPQDAQGAFITTADFREKALDVAVNPKFPRIGTVNGEQLVDLITQHWDKLPEELRDKLDLQIGLLPK